jgi:environmental stress-induced protein Ves
MGQLHFFDLARLAATPWKNGGGSTRELVSQPRGAGMDTFDWRVSIATIEAAGPFSSFPGIDRVILLLTGAGVRLRADGIDHRLDTPLRPFAFAGDVALDCEPLGGASTDFNVMTRRGQCSAEVLVLRGADTVAPSGAGLVLAVGGAWQIETGGLAQTIAADSGAWWNDAMPGARLKPLGASAALVVVRIASELNP